MKFLEKVVWLLVKHEFSYVQELSKTERDDISQTKLLLILSLLRFIEKPDTLNFKGG